MIGVKEAVRSGINFVEELYPRAEDIRLEEVEPHDTEWFVVVSFATGEPTTLAHVMGTGSRLYKLIKVDLESGQPVSLKVYKT